MRYYDPEVGRFVSRDPLGMWGESRKSLRGMPAALPWDGPSL
ncbi:MAG: hypothetical protein JKY65_04940 [Planctomycetes bacterium]|nr:hypothetical protein [Planctomycetota bacterium]